MKNLNFKTFIAFAIGFTVALTDDMIVEYFGNHPRLGILFVISSIGLLLGFYSKGKVKGESC